MTIKTKAELSADVQAKFPDNTQGLISAQRLRDYLNDVNDSLLIQRSETLTMSTDPYTVPVGEVTENLLHVTSGSDRLIILPDATLVPDQSFVVLSTDNSLITVQSASPILGDANFTEPVLVSFRAAGGEWFALPLYLSRKDTVEIAFMFNEPGLLTAGEEMRLGNTEGQDNEGLVAPFAGKLVKASISRGDATLADVDIQINGTVEDTLITNAARTTHDLSIDVAESDAIMVLGGATTPNSLDHPVVILIFQKTV